MRWRGFLIQSSPPSASVAPHPFLMLPHPCSASKLMGTSTPQLLGLLDLLMGLKWETFLSRALIKAFWVVFNEMMTLRAERKGFEGAAWVLGCFQHPWRQPGSGERISGQSLSLCQCETQTVSFPLSLFHEQLDGTWKWFCCPQIWFWGPEILGTGRTGDSQVPGCCFGCLAG